MTELAIVDVNTGGLVVHAVFDAQRAINVFVMGVKYCAQPFVFRMLFPQHPLVDKKSFCSS